MRTAKAGPEGVLLRERVHCICESDGLEPTLSFRRRSDINAHFIWCVVRWAFGWR